MSYRVNAALLVALVLMIAAIVWEVRTPQDAEEQRRLVPFYTVIHSETVPGLGRIADIVIPSMTREDDRLEEVCRIIAATEGVDRANFFSTVEAFEANHAVGRDEATKREARRVGYLSSVVTGGEFTLRGGDSP